MSAVATRSRTCGRFNVVVTSHSMSQVACKVVASWNVGLRVIDKQRTEETTIWIPSMVVCNKHRCQMIIKDVVTDTGWRRLVASLVADGKMPPKRSYATVVFRRST